MIKFIIEEVVSVKDIYSLEHATLESKVFVSKSENTVDLEGDVVFTGHGSILSGESFVKEISFPVQIPIGINAIYDIERINLVIDSYKCSAVKDKINIECVVQIPGVRDDAI